MRLQCYRCKNMTVEEDKKEMWKFRCSHCGVYTWMHVHNFDFHITRINGLHYVMAHYKVLDDIGQKE
jgi:hypothetical protein